MGGSFAPDHKGMPILPRDVEVDFLRRQVLTSRTITGGLPIPWTARSSPSCGPGPTATRPSGAPETPRKGRL